MDIAIVNILTALLGLLAVSTVTVWFVLFSGYSRGLRFGLVATLLVGVVSLAVAFEIDQVDGGLVPSFKFRFAPRKDALLETPETQANGVDLTTSTAAVFPRFLGKHGNAKVTGVSLASDWERNPPKLLWRQPIGAGWSGFTAVNGYAVTMEQRGNDEMVTCYEISTGKMIWHHSVPTRHSTILGGVGPRSTPTIDDGFVYAVGATGILRCLHGADGKLAWSFSLLDDYGATPDEDLAVVAWGRAGSPLIVAERVVVPYGGPAGGPFHSLAAFDTKNGQLAWRGGDRQISYASPVLANIDGVPQILSVNENNLSSHDPRDGTVLWQTEWPGKSNADASASQPVVVADTRVFLSKGYGVGAKLLSVEQSAGGKWQIKTLWKNSRVMRTKFSNVVVLNGFVFGLSDGILECIDLETGDRKWKGGRYGHGQILGVGQKLLVQAEDGQVVLVAASPDGHRELASIDALSSKTWNNLCLYGNQLLVRSNEEAACYELPIESPIEPPRS